MFIGLHVKYPTFLSDFSETCIFSTYFGKILKYQISWKFVHGELSCCMRTDRRTDMTKLIVAFYNFANAPKNWGTAPRLICYYDLLDQIVRLKKAIGKRTFLCFSAASDTLHKGLRTFYCCRRHEIAIEALLRKTQYFIEFIAVFLNRWAAARYLALASIISGRERFSWNLSF